MKKNTPKKTITGKALGVVAAALLSITTSAIAQSSTDTTAVTKPGGKLWGLAYGDFAYKMKSDSLNRGGANQYTGIKQDENLFQIRRLYLGYSYTISKKFEAEFLLAAEDNQQSTSTPAAPASGDLLIDSKLSMFVKLANVKWKNILPHTDLSIGEMYTPACVLTSEVVWDYRCIERTVADVRRTPAWDLGAALNGTLYDAAKTEVGYHLMVGNGSVSRPENDAFKSLYGDVYAKLLNKKLIIDLYADYTKMNWTTAWHHDRSMIKGMVAYTSPKITVGTEVFYNSLMNDNIADRAAGPSDTITTKAMAVSLFARGRIYKDQLGFFIRYDTYNPSINNNNAVYEKYTPVTKTYDPNTKEQFFTAGIDYSPISKIHIMPNVWYNAYDNAAPTTNYNGYDVVYRLSIYYVYGK